jgi:hypothetical protein
MTLQDRRQAGNALYVTLLGVQSAAALVILSYIQGMFRILIAEIGVAQPVSMTEVVSLASSILVSQAAFWVRVRYVQIPRWHSLVLGHLLAFTGRISFVFGGALFGVFFLRHMPELDLDRYAFGIAWRGAIVMTTLFTLYCYALELERLGAALQTESIRTPAAEPGKPD